MHFVESEGIYECQAFREFVWQKHGFGSRQTNPKAQVTLRQVHSNRVWNADGLHDREAEGDALITARPGHSIGVRTADCVPILLLDPRSRAVAAIHAGWRGTAAQIVAAVIERLQADYASNTRHLYAAIGPCIRACCYRVGPEVAGHFKRWSPDALNEQHLDLARVNRIQMIASGMLAGQIFDCELCSACLPDRFFSFRREPANPGRMLSAICRID